MELRNGRNVVVNEARWLSGSPSGVLAGDLPGYRAMVLNHETGHWLGLSHRLCPRASDLAPLMQQQSIALQGCRPNAWPTAGNGPRWRPGTPDRPADLAAAPVGRGGSPGNRHGGAQPGPANTHSGRSQILDFYYPGTVTAADPAGSAIRVRLMAADSNRAQLLDPRRCGTGRQGVRLLPPSGLAVAAGDVEFP